MWGPTGVDFCTLVILLHINDIASISDKIYLLLFADYSNAFVSDKNLDKIMDTMNMELNKLVTCFIVNIIPESSIPANPFRKNPLCDNTYQCL